MAQVLHLTGPVLVGREEVRPQAWVIGGRITFEPPTGDHEETRIDGWVLPGLVDAHCHVGLDATGPSTARPPRHRRSPTAMPARCCSATPARRRTPAGSTTAPTCPASSAPDGTSPARRYIRNYAWEVEPEDLVERVRLEAHAGDGWVKLVGDWIDRDAGDLTPCWPADVLAEAVAAAHEEGARVTAHCFGEESLVDLAPPGPTRRARRRPGPGHDRGVRAAGIAIVPTLVNIDTFPAIAEPAKEKFPGYHAHMLDLHARRYDTVAAARDAGVAVYVGTDAGGSLPHGLVGQEVERLTRCGFSPLEAVDAATWGARAWLRRPGIEEGEEADLVVYATDPRADVGALAHPSAVVLRGAVVRG